MHIGGIWEGEVLREFAREVREVVTLLRYVPVKAGLNYLVRLLVIYFLLGRRCKKVKEWFKQIRYDCQ